MKAIKSIKEDNVNSNLVTMWMLNNLRADNLEMTAEEIHFYNCNLQMIKDYYKKQADYWNTQESIDLEISK